MSSLKTYWKILKNIVKQQKIFLYSSFIQDSKYVTDFNKKFFTKQCSIIENSCELPLNSVRKQTRLSLQLLLLVMILQHYLKILTLLKLMAI